MDKIASIFANDITRQIEEVIKVDQSDADIIAAEIGEYVVTDAIKKHFVQVLEKYQETPQKPHEGVAISITTYSMWKIADESHLLVQLLNLLL